MKEELLCVATDDEPVALEILEDYIAMAPGLTLVAKCTNAIETMKVLRTQKVDLLFIDIQMPGITGVEFIRTLKHPPEIIFTTAYPNYAVDGFELDAADYLLKPISPGRFLKAVNKVFAKYAAPPLNGSNEVAAQRQQQFLFIKCGQVWVKVLFDDILFIEGLENYVKVHCRAKTLVTLNTMKHIEEMLPPGGFLRIHRSYIVNLAHVDGVQGNIFSVAGKSLGVGKNYRKAIAEALKGGLAG